MISSTRECLEQLLPFNKLRGIAASARESADHKRRTRLLHGVDGEPADDNLLPSIKSAVPVLAATREGRTDTLHFAGPVPLDYMTFFSGTVPSSASQASPFALSSVYRFCHVKESCSWPGSCIRCGWAHTREEDYRQLHP
ncbi:hypothetical protein MRX96_008965 [Rhipicephalus microplus]